MNPFTYTRAERLQQAIGTDARILAGGTNLVDLMKYRVDAPSRILDISRLPGLSGITPTAEGGLHIGALATNAAVADHAAIRARYPLLSAALLAGATPQLRNVATTGGNLLQRTRCYYFYDAALPCNKRAPGSGCPAIGGVARIHAILGASDHCIATHPSDMCVALAALEAVVRVQGPGGTRSIPFSEFHRLPGDDPSRDSTLEPGELVIAVILPPQGFADHFTYLKLRDRQSYAFALVSVAVALELRKGRIDAARIALGGVAHKPWRLPEAEAALCGKAPADAVFAETAATLLKDARGQGGASSGNAFKIDLARRAILRALRQAAAGTPQSNTDKRIR